MSWSIAEIKNTVKISKKCAQELFDLDAYLFCTICEKKMSELLPGEEPWDFYCYEKDHETTASKLGNLWDSPEEVTCDSKLSFNIDHMEWMDYIANSEEIKTTLKKHKVKGDICFGSLEGDNAGSFWGYRFDGKGGMKTLTGELTWSEDAGTAG